MPDDLPPGCSLREINERFGPPKCVSCGLEIDDEDQRPRDGDYCQDCTEFWREVREQFHP